MPTPRTPPVYRIPPRPLALLLGCLALLCACSDDGNRGDSKPLAPGFALETPSGEIVRLSDYRGQVVMLHFWATWCAPCRAAISHEVKFQERYGKRGFTVLGLNMDKDRQDVVKFLERHDLNYPTLFVDEETRAAYGGVSNIPLTVVIDRSGRIQRRNIGYTLQLISSLERTIEALLAKEGPGPSGP